MANDGDWKKKTQLSNLKLTTFFSVALVEQLSGYL